MFPLGWNGGRGVSFPRLYFRFFVYGLRDFIRQFLKVMGVFVWVVRHGC